MSTTANYGISKPGVHWFDENPGQGFDALVSQALDGVDEALSSGGRFKTLSVSISSAQLLAMQGTPIEIVPAMPGILAMPLSAALQYIPVSVDYALGDAVNLYIGSEVQPISTTNVLECVPAAVLDGSSGPGNVVGLFPAVRPIVTPQSYFDNHALVLTHDGTSELTLGDGTAIVTITCMLVPL